MSGSTQQTLGALSVSAIATLLGFGLAWLGGSSGQQLLGFPLLCVLALIAFSIQWLAYIPAYLYQTEHYYDLIGSSTYLLVTWLAVTLSATGAGDVRSWLLAGLITVWAARLGSFLFRRVKRSGKDGRFDQIKTQWAKFLMAWTLQGLWVFVTLFAALLVMSNSVSQPLGGWAALGLLVWLTGFAIEAIADAQKARFASDPANRGRFINVGLWRWSRHPNYFGEITLWLGIAIIAAPVFSGWQWLGLISPLFVFVLLMFISGVPLLEQRGDEKWGTDEDYQRYKKATPVLLMWPPSRGAGE